MLNGKVRESNFMLRAAFRVARGMIANGLSECMVRRRVASEKRKMTVWSALMYSALSGVRDSGP